MAFILRPSAIIRLGCAKQSRILSTSCLLHGRIVPFKLADIGEGIREVVVKEWFVKPGDKVAQFDNVCEVQSDKASVTITSRYDGHIKALHYKVDDTALVGNPLVDIEVDGTDESHEAKETPSPPEKTQNGTLGPKDIQHNETSNQELLGKVLATPAVRRIAIENNIKLKDVVATGRNGRVVKEDVLAYLGNGSSNEKKTSVTEIGRIVPLTGYTKHMWRTMTQSLSIPHFVYSDECNATKLVGFREEAKAAFKEQGISLTYMPFFIKAASKALEKFPQLNARVDEQAQTVEILTAHNISIAMDTPDGLVVPSVKNVQNLSIVQVAQELNRLQELGKKASVPLNDITGGTFSLSNIGVVGGTYTKPVILPPQVVIGAIGKAQKLPRFDDEGNVVPAHIISVSWAADHRVVDGVTMAKFSNLWKYYVENPSLLALGL